MNKDMNDLYREGINIRELADKAEPYQPKQANWPDATTGEELRKPSRIKLIPFN